MEFDIKRVYSAVNADEVKVGSKVIVADTMSVLRSNVEYGFLTVIREICEESCQSRFRTMNGTKYLLAYLIEEPEEKKLKWTDLKIGDVVQKGTLHCMVQSIDCNPNETSHIAFDSRWVTDTELSQWEKVEND